MDKERYSWESLFGERVRHIHYGDGTIVNIDFDNITNDIYIQVKFDQHINENEFNYTAFVNKYIRFIRTTDDSKLIRSIKILFICKERHISHLIHFTRINNLMSILENGLVSRIDLIKLPKKYQAEINDKYRYDGQLDAICLSVSFPNYKMFFPYRMEFKDISWAVLLLDSSILWELDCAFCLGNASASYIKNIPINDRKKASALQDMFNNFNNIKRNDLKIPDNFTTNPQAEVLVFNPIPSKYITSIHFDDILTYLEWKKKYLQSDHNFEYVHNTYYFEPRKDWPFWVT